MMTKQNQKQNQKKLQGIRSQFGISVEALVICVGVAFVGFGSSAVWSQGGDGGGPQLKLVEAKPSTQPQGEGGDGGGPRKNPTKPA